MFPSLKILQNLPGKKHRMTVGVLSRSVPHTTLLMGCAMPGWALHSVSSSGLCLGTDARRMWKAAHPFHLGLTGKEEGKKPTNSIVCLP